MKKESYTASLVTQGKHKFYTLTMPISALTNTCFVADRESNPNDGFQRLLDEKRAIEIANYIDNMQGVIPTSIVLSAQPDSDFKYESSKKTVSFSPILKAFLVIDGQHRVFGFKKAKTNLRVPVVIFSGLDKTEEARLFIDINTKQKPVPNELLLDIKNLARYENEKESYMRSLYDNFNAANNSYFKGLLSPAKKEKNKITRVTFNNAVKLILPQVINNQPERLYEIMNSFYFAFSKVIPGTVDSRAAMTNSTLFTAITLLFPKVSIRVADKFQGKYSIDNFYEILQPLVGAIRASTFSAPGNSYKELSKTLAAGLERVNLTF